MAEEQNERSDIGMYARHPLRTMGVAFLAGAAIGMNMVAARKIDRRSGWQKFMDHMN